VQSRKVINVSETPSIDVEKKDSTKLNKRLELEGSISISESCNLKLNQDHMAKKNEAEPWYFTHM